MLFIVVATKIADGRCEKKLTYIYLKIIFQFQSMLFKPNICKVLTRTKKKHILETAANINKLVNWNIVNDRHGQLAMNE